MVNLPITYRFGWHNGNAVINIVIGMQLRAKRTSLDNGYARVT
jgi:hypothetical protein